MKPSVVALVLAAAIFPVWCGDAAAAPKPSDALISWQLQFDFQDLRSIQVRLPGEDKLTTFWYLRYTITNRSLDPATNKPTEQIFIPEFVLYTDTGQIIRGGYKVPAVVFETIKKFYNDPLLKDQTAMNGKILYGEDNAKSGVAIWPQFDSKAGLVDLFIAGLSGETQEITLPKPITVTEKDPETGKTREVQKDKIFLTKTLHLQYQVPGEAAARLTSEPALKKKEWVMR